MSNFWDFDTSQSSYNEEEYEQLPPDSQQYQEDAYPDQEDLVDQQMEYEEEQVLDINQTLGQAQQRLEQANLYRILLEHDWFDSNAPARPAIIDIVQNEIRSFITERLEILLGMRQPKQQASEQYSGEVFNDHQIEVLKAIANKVPVPQSSSIKSIPEKPNQNQGLKRLSSPTPRQISQQPIRQPSPQRKPIQKRPAQKNKQNPKNKPVNPWQMSPEELAQMAQRAKTGQVINPNRMPMPSNEQANAKWAYEVQQTSAASNGLIDKILSIKGLNQDQ